MFAVIVRYISAIEPHRTGLNSGVKVVSPLLRTAAAKFNSSQETCTATHSDHCIGDTVSLIRTTAVDELMTSILNQLFTACGNIIMHIRVDETYGGATKMSL